MLDNHHRNSGMEISQKGRVREPKIDVVGKATLDLLALIGFVLLARKFFAGAKTAEGDAIASSAN